MTSTSQRVMRKLRAGRRKVFTFVGGPYAGEKARLDAMFNSSYPFRAKGQLGYYVIDSNWRVRWISL